MSRRQLDLIRSDICAGRDALADRPLSVPFVSRVLIQLTLPDNIGSDAIDASEDCGRFCVHVMYRAVAWHFPGSALAPVSTALHQPWRLAVCLRFSVQNIHTDGQSYTAPPHKRIECPVLLQIIYTFPAPPSTLVHAADDLSKPKCRVSVSLDSLKRRRWSTSHRKFDT